MTSATAMTTTEGRWWSPEGWLIGSCRHDEMVHDLSGDLTAVDDPYDKTKPTFLPGTVDLHVHGSGGHDVMSGEAAIRGMLLSAAQNGTSALLATSVTAKVSAIDSFLEAVHRVMENPDSDGARLLGAHLEGPFINPEKLGAQPPYALAVDLGQLERWLSTGVVRVITFAPELAEADAMVDMCDQFGVKAQIGHTLCDWQTAVHSLRAGCGVTHLFNAMSGVAARAGGAAVAALAEANYAEIITDGIHVDEVAFNAARRAIPSLYSVTDATAATAMPDGVYQLGDLRVHKEGHAVRLADGTLAGSCLTQLRSIEVLRQWGLDWYEIALRCSVLPARWIDDKSVGCIQAQVPANWLEVVDDQVAAIWLNGSRQPL
ncbi:MAG: amidohydrolase family protein [Granulosicoccus sp.]|nr:amidohydrolase family protein [Granulosicoccus sp.]